MSMKAAWREGLMTDEFDEFLCRPDKWRPVFPEATMRETLAEIVLNHVMVPGQAEQELVTDRYLEATLAKVKLEDGSPDPTVVPIITDQILRLSGGSYDTDDIEEAAMDIANVLNYVAFQYVGHTMRSSTAH